MSPYYLYILALENNNYYVGITQDVNKRYEEHTSGRGAHFTRMYHPIGLICCRELPYGNKKQAEVEETKVTLLMMALFGIEHVRGGDYYQANIYDVKRAMGETLYSGLLENAKTANRDMLLKNYPEIKYGLEILKMHIDYPINIMSYRNWPTREYFDSLSAIRTEHKEEIAKIVSDYSCIFKADSFDEKIFKEMVNRLIDCCGYADVSMQMSDGKVNKFF